MVLLAGFLLSMLQSQVVGCQPDCKIVAPHIETVMAIDGHLSEPEWLLAQPADSFQQFTPQEGARASLDTEVRILHDGRILYIGARMYDSDPGKIRKTRGRRDVFNSADWFAVAIDTYGDGHTAFQFAANAAGVRVEGLRVDGVPRYAATNPFGLDTSWDAEWRAKAYVDSAGWTLEMAIPMSEIELRGRNSVQLGVNFSRFIARRAELSEWALVRARDRSNGTVMRYGTLDLSRRVDPGLHRNTRLALNVFKYDDTDDLLALPVPSVDFSLAISPAFVLQAAAIPDLIREDFDEFLQVPYLEVKSNFQLPRTFVAVQQLLSGPSVIGNAVFQQPLGSVDNELIIGAAAAHGRLPISMTYSGAYFTSTRDFRRVNEGFHGRIRQNIGPFSSIGLSMAIGPYGPVREELERAADIHSSEYALAADVASLDWDLRAKSNSLRITGQAAVSREQDLLLGQSLFQTNGGTQSYIREIKLRSPQSTEHGFAAQLQVERLDKTWNPYGGFALVDSNYRMGPYGRTGLTDRIMIYSGLNHSATRAAAPFHSLHVTTELTQHFAMDGFRQAQTQWSGYAAALTRSFNQVLLSVRASRLTGSRWQATADLAGSTDQRSKWILHPKAAVSVTGGNFSWHISAAATGLLGPVVSVDLAVGLEGRSSKASESIVAMRSLLHVSSASLSGFRSMATSAYKAVWQTFPWVGFSLPALNAFGIPNARKEPYRQAFARAGANISILPRIDLEMGAAVQGSGGQPSSERVRMFSGGGADVFLSLGWEYKASSRLEVGIIRSWQFESWPELEWHAVSDLFTQPFSFPQEHLYIVRITRKIWR